MQPFHIPSVIFLKATTSFAGAAFEERPELSNLPSRQILVPEREEPLRAGDFVLCTTSLRSWTAAILGVLHDTFFKNGKCMPIHCLFMIFFSKGLAGTPIPCHITLEKTGKNK